MESCSWSKRSDNDRMDALDAKVDDMGVRLARVGGRSR
jgi:hypothetical protein